MAKTSLSQAQEHSPAVYAKSMKKAYDSAKSYGYLKPIKKMTKTQLEKRKHTRLSNAAQKVMGGSYSK